MKTYIEIAAGNAFPNDLETLRETNATNNFIAEFFTRVLNDSTLNIEKIRLELVREQADFPDHPVKSEQDIFIWCPFDFNHFFSLNKEERKSFILETLYNAINLMCNELNYDPKPFREAYEQVKALNYQNEYVHGKLKSAPDRRHKAGVHIRVEEEHAVLSALVQDSEGNETTRIEILRTLPHYMFIYKFIHQTKWLDKDRFQISDKSGQVVFEVNVQEQKAAMHLQPKNLSLPELVQEVAQAMADKSL